MDSNHILEQLNKFEYSKPLPNPIIAELKRIYKNQARYNTLTNAIPREGRILSSDTDDIFSNSLIEVELISEIEGKINVIRRKINSTDFPTSAFDVFIAHYQILASNDKLSYPAIDKKLTINKFEDILFIKVKDKCTYIFTENGEYFISMNPLEKFKEVLCVENLPFININKGYIVNADKINHIDNRFRALIPFDKVPIKSIIDEKIFEKIKKNDDTTVKEVASKEINDEKVKIIDNKIKEINEKIKDCPLNKLDDFINKKRELERELLFLKLGDMFTKSKFNNKIFIAIKVKEELQKDIQMKIMSSNTK